jgi:hypothetical protein
MLRAMKRAAGILVFLIACGEAAEEMTPTPEEKVARVRFEYRARTVIPDEFAQQYAACAALVGPTHIHPSWRDYRVIRLHPEEPELWTAIFPDVPVGSSKIRISDVNACPTHPTGAVTAHLVYANGVLLTRKVDTPGDGIEPGFYFEAREDGTVEP